MISLLPAMTIHLSLLTKIMVTTSYVYSEKKDKENKEN